MADWWEQSDVVTEDNPSWWEQSAPLEEEENWWEKSAPITDAAEYEQGVAAAYEDAPDVIDLAGGRLATAGNIVHSFNSFLNESLGDVAKAAKASYEYVTTDLGESGGRSFMDIYNETTGDIGGYQPHEEAAYGRKQAGINKQLAAESMPENPVGKFMVELADATVMMAPSVAVGGLPGVAANTALSIMGAAVYTTTYTDQINSGKGKDEAHTEAMYQTLWEMGPEKAAGFFDNLGIAGGFKEWAKQAGREAVSEVLTENLNVLDEHFRKGEPEITFAQYAKRTGHAAAAGAALGGVLSGGPRAVQQTEEERIAQRADAYTQEQEQQAQAREDFTLQDEQVVEDPFAGATDVIAPKTPYEATLAGLEQTPIPTTPEEVEATVKDVTIGSVTAIQEMQQAMDARFAEVMDAISAPREADVPVPSLPGGFVGIQPQLGDAPLPERPTAAELGSTAPRDISEPPARQEAQSVEELYSQLLDFDTMTDEEVVDTYGMVGEESVTDSIQADIDMYLSENDPAEQQSWIDTFRAELRRKGELEFEEATAGDRTFEVDAGQVKQAEEFAAASEEAQVETERADSLRRAKRLDTNRELSVQIVENINNLGIKWVKQDKARRLRANSKRALKGEAQVPNPRGWEVTDVDPEGSRVYATYTDANDNSYTVSWRVGETEVVAARTATGHLLREGTERGLDRPTKGARPRVQDGEVVLKAGGGVPRGFRQEVDRVAQAAMVTKDGTIVEMHHRKRRSAPIAMQGATPISIHIMQAQVQAEKDYKNTLHRQQSPDADEIARVREEAAVAARKDQSEVRVLIEKNIRAQGGTVARGYKNIIPEYEADRGVYVVNIITGESLKRLRDNTTVQETGVQVLPDGAIRNIHIKLNEDGDGYNVVAISRGTNEFEGSEEERTLGTAAIHVSEEKLALAKESSRDADASRAASESRLEAEGREQEFLLKQEVAKGFGGPTAPAQKTRPRARTAAAPTVSLTQEEVLQQLDNLHDKMKKQGRVKGKFIPVKAWELAQMERKLVTYWRAQVDKDITDAAQREIDQRSPEEYEEYVLQLANVLGKRSARDRAAVTTDEEIQATYEQEDLNNVHAELKEEVIRLTDREAGIYEVHPREKVQKEIARFINSGATWETAIDTLEVRYGVISKREAAARKEAVALHGEQIRTARARRERRETAPFREELTELQLGRRGRLRPTGEEGPVDNLAERAVSELSSEIARARKEDATRFNEEATLRGIQDLETKKAIADVADTTEGTAEEVRKAQINTLAIREEVKTLRAQVESDKLAAQVQRARDQQRRDSEAFARETGLTLEGKVDTSVITRAGPQGELALKAVTIPVQPAATPEVTSQDLPPSPKQAKRQAKAAQAALRRARNKARKAQVRMASDAAAQQIALQRFAQNTDALSSVVEAVDTTDTDVPASFPADLSSHISASIVANRNAEDTATRNKSTLDPTPDHVEAATEAVQLDGKDKTAKELWVAKGATTSLWARIKRKVRGGAWRGAGLSRKFDMKVAMTELDEQRNEGMGRLDEAAALWDDLVATLGERTAAQDNAIVDHLSGVSVDSIAKAHGIVLTDAQITQLTKIRGALDAMSAHGAEIGAFEDSRVLLAIEHGRPYLHMTGTRTRVNRIAGLFGKKAKDFTQDEIVELAALAEKAWDLPTTDAQIRDLSTAQQQAMLTKFTVFTDNMTNEKDDQTKETWTVVDGVRLFQPDLKTGKPKSWHPDFSITNKQARKDPAKLAARQRARDGLRKHMATVSVDSEAYQSMVGGMLTKVMESSRGVGGKGLGADAGIRSERDIMLSDMEIIRKSVRKMSSVLKKHDPAIAEAYKLKQKRLETMKVDEFLDYMQANYPQAEEAINRTRAEVAFNQKLRVVLEEVTNPESIFGDTAQRLSNEIMITTYLNNMSRTGFAQGWMSESKQKGMVQLADTGTAMGEATFMTPEGLRTAQTVWVAPEVAHFIKQATLFNQKEAGNTQKLLRLASTYSKYGMIILNPTAHPRNAVSTLAIHIGNGGLLSFGGGSKHGTKLSIGQLRRGVSGVDNKLLSTKEARWLSKTSARLGLQHDGGKSGALEELIRSLDSQTGIADAADMTYKYGTALTQTTGTKGKSAWNRIKTAHDEAFRLEDEAVKLVALLDKTHIYLNLHGEDTTLLSRARTGETLNKEETEILERALQNSAKEIVATYPTFSKAAPWVKTISRFPIVGAFPTFTYEMMRNTVNSVRINGMLMAGRTSDGRTIKGAGGKAKAAALGAHNMAMRALLAGGSTWAANALLRGAAELLGDDDEEIIAVQEDVHGLLPWFERDGTNAFMDIDRKAGTMRYLVLDYLNPYGGIEKAVRENWNNYQDAYNSGDPNMIEVAVNSLGGGFADLFLNDEILAGTVSRRMKMDDPESYDKDNLTKVLGDKVQKAIQSVGGDGVAGAGTGITGAVAGAVVETFFLAPYINTFDNIIQEMDDAETEEGRTVAEILRIGGLKAMGIKEKEYSFYKDFAPTLKGDLKQFRSAHTDMIKQLVQSHPKTEEDFLVLYRGLNATRKQKFDVVHENVRGAQTVLDVSVTDFNQGLDNAGLTISAGEISRNQFINGQYTPPSSQFFWEEAVKYADKGSKEHLRGAPTIEYLNILHQWYINADHNEDIRQ